MGLQAASEAIWCAAWVERLAAKSLDSCDAELSAKAMTPAPDPIWCSPASATRREVRSATTAQQQRPGVGANLWRV